ncbi:MAG: 5-formyltetrahydrofolate cyclo-ligase [Gammaproteobacteria bacterium]|nr:5-formyltetrahydrofolate cyclo-ligase [Gammaproteobacteria bacterium]MCF6363554.1 5-formyltetrahydrofolate cyclo-ligase [Gammaproteobacteria bacterium]
MNSRANLRREMRTRRRGLTDAQRTRLSEYAAACFRRHRLFHHARRVAAYLPNDGELDPMPLMALAWAMGKQVYLPVLSHLRSDHLLFAPYAPGDALRENRFGIPEPVVSLRHMIDLKALDLVLTPLVAFDGQGNRLGMGGGFYDRSFAFLRRRRHWFKPHLVGMAYDFQRVDCLQHKPWDVPLQGVVTEKGFVVARR